VLSGPALIRTGSLIVTAVKLDSAVAAARAVIVRRLGQVTSEDTSRARSDTGDGYATAHLTIALPVDSLDESMTELATIGRVEERSQSVQDVTLQSVDLDSRTTTMRASIERIRVLMDRAQTIADVTSLEGELSKREADLESITAQLAALTSQTAVATLDLTIAEGPLAQAAPSDDGAWSALRESVRTLGRFGSAVVVGTAATLPFAVLIAVLALLGWAIRRTRSPGSTARPSNAIEPASATQPLNTEPINETEHPEATDQ
jgi:hypothetical protein